MNKEIEAKIVNTFFVSRIRDRVLFELASPKKRKDALNRVASYKTFLDKNHMIEIPKPNSDYRDIWALLKRYGAGETCYAISWNDDIDGQELPLLQALEHAVGFGMPSIIACIPNKLCYLEGEQAFGPPPRFILMNT